MSKGIISRAFGWNLWLIRRSNHQFLFSKNNKSPVSGFVFQSSEYSSKRNDLGHTTILYQDGVNIRELPLIVRKVRDFVVVCKNGGECENDIIIKFQGSGFREGNTNSPNGNHNTNKNAQDSETKEIIEGFKRCLTIKSLLSLLDTVPACEVTPAVALCALEKLIQLENNKGYRNLVSTDNIEVSQTENGEENFTRTAVFNQLVDVIVEGNNSTIIIDCLKVLGKETYRTNVSSYRARLCGEILIRATEAQLTIDQVCQAVKTFARFSNVEENPKEVLVEADKLWVGISGRQGDITASNIAEVFSVLPHLKSSRRAVLSVLERRMASVWWELRPHSPPKILRHLIEANLVSKVIQATITRWAHTNARSLQDEYLQDILENLMKLDHVDNQIIGAFERHCAKGGWSATPPMAAIAARYCANFRIRSIRVLSAITDSLVTHGKELPPGMIRDLVWSLALLNYDPPDAIWKVLDEVLEEMFAQFTSVDILDVLLACIILGRPPVNAARRIFIPSYIDRALASAQKGRIETIKTKLRLVDAALSVEWPQKWNEGRPILSRVETTSVWQDGRVRRTARRIAEILDVDLGQKSEIETQVRPGRPLPIGELHMVDVIIRSGRRVWPLNRSEQTCALLIHLPEHYCRDSTVLIGPQKLRIRHLRLVGYHVATLDYSKLSRLWVHPAAFLDYVNERIKLALDPLPTAPV